MRYGNSLSNSNKRETGIIPPPPYPPSLEGARGDFLRKLQSTSDEHSDRGENVSSPKTVILGIGNVLLSDEGIGVHVANALSGMNLPQGVSVIEGGTDGFRLLNIITEADRLIVVDAVKGGAEPGSIYRFNVDEVKNVPSGFRTSVHQVGILEVIDLSGLIGKTPKTTVIGVEPKSLEMSLELSPEIKEKIPRIIELVFEELKQN
jgi:hydrogenase maturation protease